MNNKVIKIIGLGKAGCNSLNHLNKTSIVKAETWLIDTDKEILLQSHASNKLQIESKLISGFSVKGNPAISKLDVESRCEIIKILKNTDLVFIIAGMGRSTGTNLAPIIAKEAKEMGCLTIGVVTQPFSFEGSRCFNQGKEGVNNLKKTVDTAIVISNDRLLVNITRTISLQKIFALADDIICQAIQTILYPITISGLIDLDFIELKNLMKNRGLARIGIGKSSGKSKLMDAAKLAISSPFLESSIEKAKKIIFNITGSNDLSLNEITGTAQIIYDRLDSDSKIIFGAQIDERMVNQVKVNLITTDFTS
ncbi:MAG: cell division protein FtsZ [Prochloraceae cyanobacterium]